MTTKLFIDGEAGTTGLQIRTRLEGRDDIKFLRLPENLRKDAEARAQMLNEAGHRHSLPARCGSHRSGQPDRRQGHPVSSTHPPLHRTAEGWAYGFAELDSDQREKIAASKRVANPGLLSAGLYRHHAASCRCWHHSSQLPGHAQCRIPAIRAGGKGMIAEYEREEEPVAVPLLALWPHLGSQALCQK